MKEKIELNSEAVILRKKFGEDSNSPIDVFSFIHNNDDLTIVFYPMSNRMSGICIRDGENKIIGINSISTYGRQRFTIAHELYHLYFHEDFKSIVCFTDLEMNKDPQEKEADIFASYFLAPYEALSYFIKNKLGKEKHKLNIEDVVKIEQNFGISRQAMLWRLVNDGYLSYEKAETMKNGIIASARRLGYDDELYTPSPEDKQYATFGKYIKLAEELKNKDAISQGKYEELLLNGFRSDIVYGSNLDKEEVYD
ncbi:ImmA/IrrE family metallo-endopeptidase [Sedimentibacter sp.]|uniref:ImmA/IrrE family metallo-endopeptidase n=1 Tax=Sedimentibacter sp. TaxID=1960295 RepID=UPI0028A027A1|nr:ImmA/IrrE family metallo-endopeptidase [Sedimentibacter sp.]